jgi:hypothetical protein
MGRPLRTSTEVTFVSHDNPGQECSGGLNLCGLRRSQVLGMSWDAVDLVRGEVTIKADRVSLNGPEVASVPPHRARGADPPGTVALLRSLTAHQASDRLQLGRGHPETDLVLVNALIPRHGRSCTATTSLGCASRRECPGYGRTASVVQ